MLRTPQSRKAISESASPRTPIKSAVSGKDGKCLLCGLDFKISGQNTWRSLKNKDLKDRVCRLLEKTPDFELESTRLCKKCFRRIEALYKRSKDIEDSKREITEQYEKAKESNKACFGINSYRFKRLAKQSPGTSEKRGKRHFFDTPVNEKWCDDFGCIPQEDQDKQLVHYGEECQDDFGFAPLEFHEEDFQAQFPEHGGEALQNVNITISHSIGVVESIPVKSNRGCVPHDADDRDTQLPNYSEEWQDDCGFAPLQFAEEDFQAQFSVHCEGEVPQNVNIPISHSIGVVESIPVESNRETDNVKVKVSFVNF